MVFGRDSTDRRFAQYCRTGDPDALGDVFDRTAGRLMRVAMWLAGNRADAEDLLQRTFLQAIETRSQFRAGERVLPWLMGLLGNQARKQRRERDRAAALRQQSDRVVDPEVDAAASELDAAVRTVRQRLGEPYCDVLHLHLEHGLNAKEIAERLARPAGTVRTQLMRALELLRKKLPGGFVAGLAAFTVIEASALAAVRSAVLATAHSAAPAVAAAGATTTTILGGVLMAKKTILASALVLLSGIVAWAAMRPAAPDQSPQPVGQAATAKADAASAAAAPDANSAPAPANTVDDRARRVEVPTSATWLVHGRAVGGVEKPLPGAKVRARAFLGTEAKGEPIVDAHLIADANGHFTWPLEPPTAIAFLDVRGEGERVRSYPETFTVAPGDAPPPEFDVWIVPLDAVARGRVLDPQDRPVAGARVGPSYQGGVRTDADGRFEVPVEKTSSVTLYVDAHGFVQLRQNVDVSTGSCDVELHLRAANRIHGRVTDSEQRPIAGATVRTFHTIYAEAAETGADGRFVVDNLDPSLQQHSLFARKDGYVEGKADVKATGADVEQDLVLEQGVEVRGVVVGPQGQPVPAATVFLGFSPSAYNRQDAVSAADGSFAFACVAAGDETLNVERRGLAGKRMKLHVPKPPAAPVTVRVELEAGHFIGGGASSADGKPVVGVSIAPRLGDEYLDGIRGKTDAKGRFRLDGVPASGLSLEFYGAGALRLVQPVATVDRDDLAVTLERHGHMAGTVVDGRTGKPVANFRIRFGQARLRDGEQSGGGYSATWVRGGKAFHDEHGVFKIDEEVRVGSVFALEASADGYGPTVSDHVVVALEPDPAQLVIALYPGTTITGVVRERGTGVPIAGARLKAFASGRPLQPHEPNDDEGRPLATSDERGAFHLDNVGLGDISIAVEHADWLATTHGPIAVAPGVTVPPQEIQLGRGATVTVDVRNADGTPMPDAEILLFGREGRQLPGKSDATGTARIERVPPGEYELVLQESRGTTKSWTYRRQLRVEHDDCRAEFVAKDGDATLDVVLDAAEALPEDLQIMILPKTGAKDAAFRARGALVQPGHTVVAWLPAMELTVMVVASSNWGGNAVVTALAGQTVEVHVPVKKYEPSRR
jgi:RNA polymerase sigma-70 factor (ECF subfamily)